MTMWDSIDRLIDRAVGSPAELREHRVHLLAARRWHATGRAVPPEILEEERLAGMRTLAAPFILGRIRAACDGPIILFKGPEVAAAYPDPALRPFKDLDLLVPEAAATQRALLAAGFEPVGNPNLYVDIHHERPLWLRGQPLLVEIHSVPKWPDRVAAPTPEELFALAVPSALGVEGIDALAPPYHALVVAAHAWAHEPLRRLVDVIDCTALSPDVDGDVRATAKRWGVRRIWETTVNAGDAIFADPPRRTWPLRLWARNLESVRDRTVLEAHLERWLSGFWALPPGPALASLRSTVARELTPAKGESWWTKATRTRRAVGNAFVGRRRHELENARANAERQEPA
jgi:hypothetical protein